MNEKDIRADKKIQAYITQNLHIPISDDYDSYIDQQIWKAKHARKRRRRYMRIASIILGVLLICASGVGVYATANYVHKRMEKLTQEEKGAYVEDLQNSEANADSFSRELTQEERERAEELQQKYENYGCFPEKSVLYVQSIAEVQRDRVCFEAAKSMFYLPNRELTDEELLEIIDFYYARDYSLQETTDAFAELRPVVDENKKQRMEKAAKESIYRVFLVDMSQATCSLTASSYRDADNELIQTAYVELETEGNRYAVTMDLDQEKVVCLYDDGAEPAYEMQDITWDEKMIMAEVSYAKDVAIRYAQDNAVHPKMILYEMDESGIKIKNGVADYCFDKKDGVVAIKVDVVKQTVKSVNYYTYNEFENMLKLEPVLTRKNILYEENGK